jgi:DNA-binding MarR family transcriptional regulator/GNAT superfamily N-acetyltransferase
MLDDDEQTDAIRAFNRFYTRQIGLLNEHIVWSPFSLSEARVLYEISHLGHTTAADLSRVLDLDRAYLSRLLQKFLALDMVALSPIPNDRRQNSIALTAEGDTTVAALNAGSNAAMRDMLTPLSEPERAELVAMMQRIRTLLGDSTARQGAVVLRPERIGELGWLIHRQAVLYNEQHGWNAEFEGLIARIYSEFQAAPVDPPRALWVADRGGQVLGSVFVTPHATRPSTAQLRMLYVEPAARGEGIGTMLVAQSIDFARRNGYARLRLWTQSVLTSARRIYAAAGFKLVESGPHHSFGKDLVGEYWELEF